MNEKTEIKLLFEFLKQRYNSPTKSIAFKLYFWVVIITVGLGASFITLYDTINVNNNIDLRNISLTLVGYSLVLLCSSAIEIIFIEFKKNYEEDFKPLKNALTMLGISSILIGIVFSMLVYYINLNYVRLIISLIMTISVLYFWWIANSKSLIVLKSDEQQPTPENTTGGNENQKLPGQIPNGYKI